MFGANIDLEEFARLYENRVENKTIKIPRALDDNFLEPKTPVEKRIKAAIDAYRAQQQSELEAELFKQRTRLNDAERALAVKETKKALEDQRISSKKMEWLREKLADLHRTELAAIDSRIFPMWFAPVVVLVDSKYVVKPMCYHCRPPGVPESFDKDFDGTYNARRDNLDNRLWKPLFGKNHAIIVITGFYENVAQHKFQHRMLAPNEKQKNVILHFNPQPEREMLLACIWSRWISPGKEDLLSFAAISDEPPEEIAVAGHDRCVIPLMQNNLAEWMDPEKHSKDRHYAILDDRERPFYEHRLAA